MKTTGTERFFKAGANWVGDQTLREEFQRVEERLRVYSRAVEQNPASIVITDTAGRIEYVNLKFIELTGYTLEEVRGKNPRILKSGATPSAEYRRLWDNLRAGREWRGEFHNRKKNGELYWESALIAPILDPDGRTSHYLAIKEDITEQKLAAAKLAETQRQLLTTSRLAGMAEVAADIIHSVGNVLNSVNVSAGLLAEKTRKSQVRQLGEVVALLDRHANDLGSFITDNPKGRLLPGYLKRLFEQLVREQQGCLVELKTIQENIDRIRDIVAMHQDYVQVPGVVESVQPVELVEEVLRMNALALAGQGIHVVREYAEVLPVTVEKHKALHVLAHLVQNAKEACNASGREDKQLRLEVTRSGDGVCIAVIDNGIGIPPENMTRIFNQGFTTRQDGHGFALHNGALAASEMGGSLTAQSEGPGRGATFILTLPLQSPQRQSGGRPV